MDPASVVVAKQLSTNSRSLRLSPMSFSSSFITFKCTVRSMIHLELILVWAVRSVSGFLFLLHVSTHFVPGPFVEKMAILHGI